VSGQAGRFGAFARIAAEGAAFLLLLLFLAVPAGAAGEQKVVRPDELGRQPIEITADRLSADSARESVSFEGNEGTMELDSPRSRILPRGEPDPGRQG